MLRQSIVAFAAVAATVSASFASSQTADEFIMNAWSNTKDCNRNHAQSVYFPTLATRAEELLGKCVAVEGFWVGRAIFGSISDAKARRANTTGRLRGKRVGLYAEWERVGEPPSEPVHTMFVGRVGQCETQWPDELMVMGYCHYTGGQILLVAEAFSDKRNVR